MEKWMNTYIWNLKFSKSSWPIFKGQQSSLNYLLTENKIKRTFESMWSENIHVNIGSVPLAIISSLI